MMALEGALRVGLRLGGGRVQAVRIRSTRPDVAAALLSGRTRAEAAAAVPLMFSICSRSQAAAADLACGAAAGESPTAQALARCSAAVAAETLREGAWRALLDAPRWLGEAPTEAAVAAARGALAGRAAGPDAGTAEAIARAAFGMPAAQWLAGDSLAALERWADGGATATARFIRQVLDDDEADAPPLGPAAATPLLAERPHAAWVGDLAQAVDDDPDFARAPRWRGRPAETGALARRQADTSIQALMARSASRVPARFVARLRELALLLAGRETPALGALALGPGRGMAWVENARGLLVHVVRLDGQRVTRYRIVAPTEWNFHPEGALPQALLGAPAGDPGALQRRGTRLVHSLDPCVSCQVEFDDA